MNFKTSVFIRLFAIVLIFMLFSLFSTITKPYFNTKVEDDGINSLTSNFDNNFKSFFEGKRAYYNLAGLVANKLDIHYLNKVYRDKDGYMTYPYFRLANPENIYKPLANFSSHIRADKLYVALPNVEVQYPNAFPSMAVLENTTKAQQFINFVKDSGDMLVWDYSKFNIDQAKENKFYKNDHHWKIEFAFDTFLDIAKKFEKHFNHSLPDFIFDKNNYNFTSYEDIFLGSAGNRVGKYFNNNLDTMTVITPKFDTNLNVDYAIFNDIQINKQGSFEDCFIYDDYLKYDFSYSAYNCYHGGNYQAFHSHNNANYVIDKTIFLNVDSFSVPLLAFYSLIFKDVYAVNLRSLDKSFEFFDYVDKVNPDLYIYQYGPFSIDIEENLNRSH